MVRMSDLARGRATAPPAPKPTTPPLPAPTDQPPAAPSTAPAVPRTAPAVPRRTANYEWPRAEAPVVPPLPEPVPPAAAAEPPERIFEDLRSFLEGMPDVLKGGEPPAWGALQRIVERVVRSLEAGGDLFWLAGGASLPEGRDYVAFHLSRVTVLAVRIGMTAGYERERLIEVGAAAAMSGIGLWHLPPGLLRRLDALSAAEQTQYHTHPRVAADRLRRWGPPFEKLAQTVLQYEEREQGQGFPQGLQGAAIRMEAKIVGLADTYMTMTAPPSLHPGLRPYEAVREIVRSKHEAFPSVLVKALLSDVTVFPPGTMVRLNSGEIGSVVAVNRNHPLRPRVQILSGKTGPLATPKIADLSEAPFLYITGPVTETAR
jgi:HD-GYP domain-containing protein (c-di-GMP phosphodiesterase class II)